MYIYEQHNPNASYIYLLTAVIKQIAPALKIHIVLQEEMAVGCDYMSYKIILEEQKSMSTLLTDVKTCSTCGNCKI